MTRWTNTGQGLIKLTYVDGRQMLILRPGESVTFEGTEQFQSIEALDGNLLTDLGIEQIDPPGIPEACPECRCIHGTGNTNALCPRASNYRAP